MFDWRGVSIILSESGSGELNVGMKIGESGATSVNLSVGVAISNSSSWSVWTDVCLFLTSVLQTEGDLFPGSILQ